MCAHRGQTGGAAAPAAAASRCVGGERGAKRLRDQGLVVGG